MPALGQYAFALLQDGSVNPNLTAWAATAMAFGVLDGEHGAEMAAEARVVHHHHRLGRAPAECRRARCSIRCTTTTARCGPSSPGSSSLAEYRYHNAAAGWFALEAIARTGFDQSLGPQPGGDLGPALQAARHRGAAAVLRHVDGAHAAHSRTARHRRRRAGAARDDRAAPAAGLGLGGGGERAGGRRAYLVRRATRNGRIALALRRAGGDRAPIDVEFAPALPLGAQPSGAGVETQRTPGDVHASVHAQVTEASRWRCRTGAAGASCRRRCRRRSARVRRRRGCSASGWETTPGPGMSWHWRDWPGNRTPFASIGPDGPRARSPSPSRRAAPTPTGTPPRPSR